MNTTESHPLRALAEDIVKRMKQVNACDNTPCAELLEAASNVCEYAKAWRLNDRKVFIALAKAAERMRK